MVNSDSTPISGCMFMYTDAKQTVEKRNKIGLGLDSAV